MLRDLEAGGRVEGDHIIGWMLERARKHAVDDTVLSMAYTHLKAYEQRFGRVERLSYTFDVDRPLFIGGGLWRK